MICTHLLKSLKVIFTILERSKVTLSVFLESSTGDIRTQNVNQET